MAYSIAAVRAAQAARNNAIWCDTICRAHGIPCEFHAQIWLSRQPVPRFYPNAVTFVNPLAGSAQLAHIYQLLGEALPASAGVKDSFCTLELAPIGFQQLFEATWLWRASRPQLDREVARVDWVRVRDADELATWEVAWNGPLAGEQSAPLARVFSPALLADPDIVFIAALLHERIIAGAIANRTDDVVGLSNVFAPEGAAARFWPGCVGAAMDAFAGLPLVGYESGGELAIALSLGFEVVGPLQVWVRTAE
jgi:hypothetical protein